MLITREESVKGLVFLAFKRAALMIKVDLIFWGVGGRTLFIINYKMGCAKGEKRQATKISELRCYLL